MYGSEPKKIKGDTTMYNIENKSFILTYEYNYWRHTYKVVTLKNEKELISYLANGYRPYDFVWKDISLNPLWWKNNRLEQEYITGYGKIINPCAYKDDAWIYFCEHLYNQVKTRKKYSVKNKIYKGTFRKDAIKYTGKRRGGPFVRPRKLKHIVSIYGNPEYKEFNRGSRSDYSDGWWDDWSRCREKNWKSQSKRKHQWKER